MHVEFSGELIRTAANIGVTLSLIVAGALWTPRAGNFVAGAIAVASVVGVFAGLLRVSDFVMIIIVAAAAMIVNKLMRTDSGA